MNNQLGTNSYGLYNPDEINEVLLGLYNILNLAIDINASSLCIYPFQVMCVLRNGEERRYPPIAIPSEINYLDSFRLILTRDELAQRIFEIVAEDHESIVCRINLEVSD